MKPPTPNYCKPNRQIYVARFAWNRHGAAVWRIKSCLNLPGRRHLRPRFNLRRRLLLVIFQRRQQHLRPLGVGPVHRLAVVAQRFLRESFGIPGRFCAFGTGISVTMQRNAFDFELPATLFELRRPVPCPHAGQIRGQDAFAGQVSEQV